MDALLGLSCVEASLDEPNNLTPRRLKVASLLSFLVNSGKQLQHGKLLERIQVGKSSSSAKQPTWSLTECASL
jgi:hypothetical protein